ncbi:uncharacterized protein BEWA_026840 [Theileria equi strain WA]|uniref:P-type phospholipid transporter n=1 Tax=Theileria equi strain WA TaxID=1537102 RepID=L0AWB3_THEEQ|nr:uncharacterized protein BEWA_026840 [Theileria equi strain WA]AFZ79835.1 membrane protein, putative [Theileria equi strain WA]|eukprot:XP_004829501.1 uncharacterized protein BEWA_026840 [Theileria equi strain WA]
MKVLAVLWAVCLVGLCHSGNDGKVDASTFNVQEAETPRKESQEPKEHTPVHDCKSKVDESLFDALESVADGVKVLRLLAKEGVTANKLTFGEEVVWPGKKDATCLLATIYLDNGHPRLAVLTTRNSKHKQRKVYRYHDGTQWKGYKERGHDARLKKLKEGCNSTIPQRIAPCKLDILNPDQTKVHVGDLPYKEEHELTLKKYSPDTGRHVRSIVDAGAIVWEADEYQKCIDVKSYTRGDSILLAIKVEDLDDLEHKYFEKLNGAWNEVDEDGFNDKVNIVMGGLMEYSGNEVHSETLHPVGVSTDDHVDVPPQGSTLPPQEVTTPSIQHVEPKVPIEPTTEPKVSTSEKSNEVEDSGETPVEEVQPEVAPAESPEDDEPGKESESDDMGESPVVESESKLVAVKESEPVTKEPNSTESSPSLGDSETSQEGNGGDTDEETQEPEAPMEDEQDDEEEEDATADGQGNERTYTEEEIAEFKKHLIKLASKVDKNIFKVDGIKEDNLFALQLTPKDAKPVTHVTYGEKEIWSGSTLFNKSNLVEAIIYFYKDIPALVTIKALKGNNEFMVYKFSDSEGFWYDSEEKQFNKFLEDTKKQVETIKAKEAEKAAQEESTSQDASSSDSQPSGEQEDVSQQISPEATGQESAEPAEPEQLLNPFLSKVDASLFHVEEDEEDGVKVLKLTAKKGAEATKLVYNGKEIWSGSAFIGTTSNLVEALIYFYKEVPALVTIQTIKGGNRSVIYKFSDTEGFWRDSNEEGFKKMLGDTKKQVEKLKAREAETPKENGSESSEPKDTPEVTTIQPEVQRNVGISSDNSIPSRHNATSNPKDGIKPPATTLANFNTFGRFGSMYNITSEISSKQDLLDVFGEALKFLKDKNPLSSEVDKNEAPPKVSTSSSLDKEDSMRNTRLTPSKPLDPPGPLVLDLSVESADDKVTLYKNDNGELKYRAFTSENGNYFEKILHYGVVIWEAEPGQRGTFASYHSKEDAMLVRMYVQTDGHVERKYFEKTAYGWASIEKEDYEKKLKDLRSGVTNQSSLQGSATLRTDNPTVVPSSDEFSEAQMVKQGGTTPITLDLASPNESEIGILGSDTNEVSTKTYSPKKNVKITSVVDGGLPIWKASGNETFSSAKLSSRDGYSLLLIYLKDTGNSFGKHFEKNADGWTPIDEKAYKGKLQDLKNGVTNRVFMNLFYLIISLSQLIPILRVESPITYFAPLILVLTVSILKEASDDYKRFLRDREANSQKYEILSKDGLIEVNAENIQLGSIIKLRKDQRVPADLILLRTSEANGSSFIRTDQLDGETDWKLKRAICTTQSLKSSSSMLDLQAVCCVEPPRQDIYSFNGQMTFYFPNEPQNKEVDEKSDAEKLLLSKRTETEFAQHADGVDVVKMCERLEERKSVDYSTENYKVLVEPVSVDNAIWMNTIVASGTIYGLVIYIGKEVRACLNAKRARYKMGCFDKEVNLMTKVLFAILVALSFAMVIPNGFVGQWYIWVIKFLLLFSTIIPISLRINLDLAKFVYSRTIAMDSEIPGTVPRTTLIPEELGRISYLLTDKTGTLTQNIINLERIHIARALFQVDDLPLIHKYVNNYFANYSLSNMDEALQAPEYEGATQVRSRRKSAIHSPSVKVSQTNEIETKLCLALLSLAICHNVTPTSDENDKLGYQASSPDEIALVSFASMCNIQLKERDETNIVLQINGNLLLRYKILMMFPFSSETKRMGIIISDEDANMKFFFCKGAESVMIPFLQPRGSVWLGEECDNMARMGLRTLVFGYKILSENDYNTFQSRYEDARLSIKDRQERIRKAISTLEHDLILIALTGVRDKLQPHVRSTLEALRNAGIRIWMLTGDKVDTARCIAISAGIKDKTHSVFLITSEMYTTVEEIRNQLQIFSMGPTSTLLIVDTGVISTSIREFPNFFIQVASMAHAVLCCRCTPFIKAELVRLLKLSGKRTCAIGDGDNDVPMIMEADVGIGIVGKEGLQASLSADYSITQFSYIKRIVLWHGRNSYKRSAALTHFIIHRGMILTVMQAIFSAMYFYMPLAFFQGWLQIGFSSYYTMVPIFCLILDQEIEESDVFLFPELYQTLRTGRVMSVKTFLIWVWISVFQGGVLMLGAIILFENSLLSLVAIACTSLFVLELLNLASELHTWHPLTVVSMISTAIVYFYSILILRNYFDFVFIATTSFVWKVIVITLAGWLPVYIFKSIQTALQPPQYTKLAI